MQVIFIGTPEFGAIILKKLIKAGDRPILVITEPDKPSDRKVITPSAVKTTAKEHGLNILQPNKISLHEAEIKALNPDLIITASFGQIIPKKILKIPKYGCLNVHPSLLPKYRGATPVQKAILKEDKTTGVTIMLMDEKLDHGPIIKQKEMKIPQKATYSELHNKLAELGAKLLIEVIPDWIGKKIKAKPQEEEKATFTKILKRTNGKIDWTESAQIIERKVRAFHPWPGTFTTFKEKRIKILQADFLQLQTNKKPGQVVLDSGKVAVQTGQNCLILEELQLEGKKPTKAVDFIKGHQDFIKTILK